MAEFALPSLVADALLIINAQNRFWIHAERNFLRLNRFKQFSGLSPGSFVRGFFLLALSLFSIFLLLLGSFGGGSLRLQSFYLFLGLAAFFLRRNCSAFHSFEKVLKAMSPIELALYRHFSCQRSEPRLETIFKLRKASSCLVLHNLSGGSLWLRCIFFRRHHLRSPLYGDCRSNCLNLRPDDDENKHEYEG